MFVGVHKLQQLPDAAGIQRSASSARGRGVVGLAAPPAGQAKRFPALAVGPDEPGAALLAAGNHRAAPFSAARASAAHFAGSQ